MKIFLIANFFILLSVATLAQEPYHDFLFMASPLGDNLYVVDDPSLQFDHNKEFPVIAIQANSRKYGTALGSAKFQSQDDEKTIFKLTPKAGISLGKEENVIIKTTIVDQNPYYKNSLDRLLALGVTLANNDGQVVANSTLHLFNGTIYQGLFFTQFLSLLANEQNSKIAEGKWAGKTISEVAQAAKTDDLRAAFDFAVQKPAAYAGKLVKISDIFADWAKAGCPNTATYNQKTGLGFQLAKHQSGYLQISAVDPRYWGHLRDATCRRFNLKPAFSVGILIFAIDGKSTYKQSPETFMNVSRKAGDVFEYELLGLDYKMQQGKVVLRTPRSDSKQIWINEAPNLEIRYPRLFPIVKNKKWGYIDANGTEVIAPQFDELGLQKEWFQEGVVAVRKGDKWGYINIKGDWVIEPKFESKPSPFSDGMASVDAEKVRFGFSDKVHYIDRTGTIRIKHDDSKLKPLLAGNFNDGLCPFKDSKTELYGYMNKKGEVVLKAKYRYAEDFKAGLAKIRMEADESYGIIDTKGNWIFEPKYSHIYVNKSDKQVFWSKDRETYHLSDLSGKKLFTFESVPVATFGIINFSKNGYVRSTGENGKRGLMNDKGKQIIANKYTSIHPRIDNGLLAVTETGVKKSFGYEGGWYFIDIKTGKTVIEGPFVDVDGFNEGVCWVKNDKDRWILIDTEGKALIEPGLDKYPMTFVGDISRYDAGSLLEGKKYIYFDREGNIIWQDK